MFDIVSKWFKTQGAGPIPKKKNWNFNVRNFYSLNVQLYTWKTIWSLSRIITFIYIVQWNF